MNKYYIGIYWKSDNSNIEEIEKKLVNTFLFFSSIDISLASWYSTDKPKRGMELEPINHIKIKDLLLKSIIYNDDNEIQSKLGYELLLKSEKAFEKSNILSITCGVKNNSVPNSIVLNLNKSNFENLDVLFKIFVGLIKIWNPDNGLINRQSVQKEINQNLVDDPDPRLIIFNKLENITDIDKKLIFNSGLGQFIIQRELYLKEEILRLIQ
jgi:hypothetical protein